MKWVIGVDEAGRGALAGPVAVGAAMVPHDFVWGLIPGVTDSKLLSPKQRDEIYTRAAKLRRAGIIDFKVAFSSERIIDERGITKAVARGIVSALRRLECDPKRSAVKLDGLLSAPEEYEDRETIVRGDLLVPAISLASIVAKVSRDRLMVRLSKKYPEYAFAQHKGYGTLLHRNALQKQGISDVHRASYCRFYTS